MSRAFTVKLSDIQRCPKHSMLPAHYRDDGSCLCFRPDGDRVEPFRHAAIPKDTLGKRP